MGDFGSSEDSFEVSLGFVMGLGTNSFFAEGDLIGGGGVAFDGEA